MKKKLLVVDDEERILAGMRRALRPHSRHWSMVFVSTGQEAIDSHQAAPCDMVISDYRMPLMNGYELLSWFRQNAPGTLRVTLTGQIDRTTYFKNLEISHFFIWKPAHSSVLSYILNRALGADRFLPGSGVRSYLQNLTGLPLSTVPREHMHTLLRQEQIDYRALSEVISSDLTLSAQILRLLYTVNPSGRELSSLEQGLRFLDVKTLRELLLNAGLFLDPLPANDTSFKLCTLNEHSRQTARLAQLLMAQAPQKQQFQAYFAALLHDLGYLLLHLCCPEECAEIRALTGTRFISQVQAEQKILGFTHAEIGGFITYLWGFPDNIVEAIYRHHAHPLAASATLSPVPEAVWHANRISHGRLGQSARQNDMIMAAKALFANGRPTREHGAP